MEDFPGMKCVMFGRKSIKPIIQLPRSAKLKTLMKMGRTAPWKLSTVKLVVLDTYSTTGLKKKTG